jgi:hypothetical protein
MIWIQHFIFESGNRFVLRAKPMRLRILIQALRFFYLFSNHLYLLYLRKSYPTSTSKNMVFRSRRSGSVEKKTFFPFKAKTIADRKHCMNPNIFIKKQVPDVNQVFATMEKSTIHTVNTQLPDPFRFIKFPKGRIVTEAQEAIFMPSWPLFLPESRTF